MTLGELVSLVIGPGAVASRDIDRRLSPDDLLVLAHLADIDVVRIYQTTLTSLQGSLWGTFPASKGWVPWIVPAQLRRRTTHGLQFCPQCLADDDEPYFRLSWRLALVTLCSVHKVILSDRCPRCGLAVKQSAPSRSDGGSSLRTPLHCCRWCGQDLRSMPMVQLPPPIVGPEPFRFQERLMDAVRDGWIDIAGHGPIHALPFFRGFHQVLKILTSAGVLGRLRSTIQEAMGEGTEMEIQAGRSNSALFEIQNVVTRHQILRMGAWILDGWPHRLVDSCKSSGLRSARLTDDFQGETPYWIWKVTEEWLSFRPWRWRKVHMADGRCSSYNHLGNLASSRKLIREAQRVHFVRNHPELWGDPRGLAQAMKLQRLYSDRSEVTIIAKHCQALVDYAKNPTHRPIAGPVILTTSNGRRKFRISIPTRATD